MINAEQSKATTELADQPIEQKVKSSTIEKQSDYIIRINLFDEDSEHFQIVLQTNSNSIDNMIMCILKFFYDKTKPEPGLVMKGKHILRPKNLLQLMHIN